MALQIKDYQGEGYKMEHVFKSWGVAYLNYAERFDRITFLERHLESDEVFVLLEGTADLIIGLEKEVFPMERGKIYNVEKGTWHNIKVSRDAHVLIVEGSDVTKDNSEYRDI